MKTATPIANRRAEAAQFVAVTLNPTPTQDGVPRAALKRRRMIRASLFGTLLLVTLALTLSLPAWLTPVTINFKSFAVTDVFQLLTILFVVALLAERASVALLRGDANRAREVLQVKHVNESHKPSTKPGQLQKAFFSVPYVCSPASNTPIVSSAGSASKAPPYRTASAATNCGAASVSSPSRASARSLL